MITVAFVGNPNSGKTAWINALSHAGFQVGNWPGVTVEKREAEVCWQQIRIRLIDLPGIYDLNETGNEERITVNFLRQERVDCLINVLDATNLRRALLLTMKLRLLQIPMVLLLNFYDEVVRGGMDINAAAIAEKLRCPVLCVSALRQSDFQRVKACVVQQLHSRFEGYWPLLPEPLRTQWHEHLRLLQLASPFARESELLAQACRQFQHEQPQQFQQMIRENVDSLMRHVRQDPHRTLAKTSRIDAVLLHRVWGLPLMLGMSLLLMMWIYNGSAPYVSWLNQLTLWLQQGLRILLQSASDTLVSLLCEGLVGGVGGVLSFVPLMAFLYFALAVLEESGYLARIAFLMDRLMKPFGISGRAFVALLLGLGCNVPAIMATRMIEEPRHRRKTALIVPLISCGARLPVYLLFAAAFFPGQGAWVLFALYGLSLSGALTLSMILTRHDHDPQPWMLLELPVYRRPVLNVVLNKVRRQVGHYLRKSLTVVLLAMTVLWGFAWFPSGDPTTSYAAQFGQHAAVIFRPLGFGESWQLVASLPGSLAAKETVVGFLSSLFSGEAPAPEDFARQTETLIAAFPQAVAQSLLGWLTPSPPAQPDPVVTRQLAVLFPDPLGKLRAFCFLVYCLFSVPCVMTLNALRQEYGIGLMLQSIVLMVLLPYGISLLIFQLGRLLFLVL